MPRLRLRLSETDPRGPGVFRRRGRPFSAQPSPGSDLDVTPASVWAPVLRTGGCWMLILLSIAGALVLISSLAGCSRAARGPRVTKAIRPERGPGLARPPVLSDRKDLKAAGQERRRRHIAPAAVSRRTSHATERVSRPAMCGIDEMMVSATCISRTGSADQAPKTIGDTGASCDPRPGQSDIPDVVILCGKRTQ